VHETQVTSQLLQTWSQCETCQIMLDKLNVEL